MKLKLNLGKVANLMSLNMNYLFKDLESRLISEFNFIKDKVIQRCKSTKILKASFHYYNKGKGKKEPWNSSWPYQTTLLSIVLDAWQTCLFFIGIMIQCGVR